MEKTQNNLRVDINSRIYKQVGGEKGLSSTFKKLKQEKGWKTPQPLYNVKTGEANLTLTTLHDIGDVDHNFSADVAIFGEYRLPPHLQDLQERNDIMTLELQREREEKRKAEVRAERAESLNEILQASVKESMKEKGVNFQMGDPSRRSADEILMMYLGSVDFSKGSFSDIN